MSSERLAAALERLAAGDAPLPPAEQIHVGDGHFLDIAAEFLAYFVEVGGLRPDASVLDAGCGIGRMAAGLSLYLDPEKGRYIGFDPVKPGIEWCSQAYADRSNFAFHWADIYNELYRPDGQILATRYRFPAENDSIDFALLTSVFTHLYEPEIAAYFKELRRVVKPAGRIFATAYLFEGDAPVPGQAAHLRFDVNDADHPHRWHVDGMPPLAAVAFSESYFAELAEGVTGRKADIRPGRWRGGTGPWFQDLVLL